VRRESKEKRVTTSKLILWATYLLFASQVFIAVLCTLKAYDTSVFMYTIPATAGLAGATTVFYMNKSKMENVFRFKISFLEYKLDLIDKHPDKAEIIDKDLSSVEEALDTKVDNTMTEAINEDIEIPSY
jgi:hypothetical protein